MPIQTSLPKLKINKVTQAQYDSMERNPNELYIIVDAKLRYDDLDYKPVETYVPDQMTFTDWVGPTEYPPYNFQCDIMIDGVLSTDIPYVNFGMESAISGIYAPVSEAFDGFVRIFAKEQPETPVEITSIVCQRVKE